MKLELTEEQQMVQTLARDFATLEVKPIAAECDREGRFPHATVKRMGELGLMGIAIPETLGGSGADMLSYVLALVKSYTLTVACTYGVSIPNDLADALHIADDRLDHRLQ